MPDYIQQVTDIAPFFLYGILVVAILTIQIARITTMVERCYRKEN